MYMTVSARELAYPPLIPQRDTWTLHVRKHHQTINFVLHSDNIYWVFPYNVFILVAKKQFILALMKSKNRFVPYKGCI